MIGFKKATGIAAAFVMGGATIIAGAGAAGASSFNCVAAAGCATLQGHNAAGTAVALDAKGKVPTGILIGYPDLTQDAATSFTKVPHTFRSGDLRGLSYYTFVYSPDGAYSSQCATVGTGGKLSLTACTNGHAEDQQFIAAAYNRGTVTVPATIGNGHSGQEYLIESVGALGALTGGRGGMSHRGVSGLLEDASTSIPLAVQTGATDTRQLDVNGRADVSLTSLPSPDANGVYTLTGVRVSQNELWRWRT